MPDEEPQSVAEASKALAAVGFDADLLEGAEPPGTPYGVAAQQQGYEPPAPAPAVPAAPVQNVPAPAAPTGAQGAPQPAPAPVPGESPEAAAERAAFEAWKNSPEQQLAAFNIQRGLTTEAGVRLIVAQGLQALGRSPEDVRAFVDGRLTLSQLEAQQAAVAGQQQQQQAPPANPWDSLTEDDVVDGEQVKQFLAEVKRQAVAEAQALLTQAQQPLVNEVDRQRRQTAANTTDATLTELLGEGGDPTSVDKELAGRVLSEASKYIQPDNWDPGHIRAAIIQGHHDVVQISTAAQRAYLNRKELVASSVPQTTGGAQAAGNDPLPEPKDLKSASQLAKELYPDLFK